MPTAPNLVLFIGRLHPLLVHLPIGFLMLLAIVEIVSKFKPLAAAAHARGVILVATVFSTFVTIVCGLMLSTSNEFDPSLLFWHKWTGILLGLGIFAAVFCFWQRTYRLYIAFIIASVVLLLPVGHYGASITHGKNYLFAYAPMWMRPKSEVAISATTSSAGSIHTSNDAKIYAELVQPVLEQNCIACHNQDKTAGKLRLDSLADIRRGGNSGPAIVAGDSSGSLLVHRLALAESDQKHMPPTGKPQPTADQIALLKWWIDSGASGDKKVAELNPSTDQLALVNRLLKIPEAVDPSAVPPISIADAQAQVDVLSPKTGIVVTPFAVDQPWLIINAAMNHRFGDGELAQLAPLAGNIVDLNLAGTNITDGGLSTVAGMSNLARLRHDRTKITDVGLAKLARLKKLTYLNLYSTAVTDKSLATLAALPNLRQLYLWQTKVDPAAAARFAASKTDAVRIAEIKKQIEKLQEQIAGKSVEVVEGIKPSTQPAAAAKR